MEGTNEEMLIWVQVVFTWRG